MYLYASITFHSKPDLPKVEYAFHFLIASGGKKQRSESQTSFCLMNSPATKFWVPSLDGCCQKGLG